MKTCSLFVLAVALLLTVSRSAYAEGGCVDSPENPTAVLAMVGAAGGFFTLARARLKAKNSTKS